MATIRPFHLPRCARSTLPALPLQPSGLHTSLSAFPKSMSTASTLRERGADSGYAYAVLVGATK